MRQIAIVGAGTIGEVHAQSVARIAGASLAAVCDPRLERARQVAAPEGARVFASLDELIKSPAVWAEVDVVLVCVPTYLHEDIVMKAAAGGKSVFCEKPLSLTDASAERMIAACEVAGVALGVGHVVRFFPEYQALLRTLSSGGIGEVGTVRTFRGGSFPVAWDNWYADEARSGGILVDLLIHDLDFVDSQIDPIASLFVRRLEPEQRQQRDYALVIGRLQHGGLLHMEATWAHASGFRYGFEVAGRTGLVDFNSDKVRPLHLMTRARAGGGGEPGVTVPESPLSESPYQVELAAFLAALERGEAVPVDGRAARRALALSLAAVRSARSGCPVDVAPSGSAHAPEGGRVGASSRADARHDSTAGHGGKGDMA